MSGCAGDGATAGTGGNVGGGAEAGSWACAEAGAEAGTGAGTRAGAAAHQPTISSTNTWKKGHTGRRAMGGHEIVTPEHDRTAITIA